MSRIRLYLKSIGGPPARSIDVDHCEVHGIERSGANPARYSCGSRENPSDISLYVGRSEASRQLGRRPADQHRDCMLELRALEDKQFSGIRMMLNLGFPQTLRR